MSPEQISSPSQIDCRTDIWSLGVVMFELLTGDVPFNGAGPAQMCAAVLTQPVPPLSNYRDDVPPALEAIMRRCLQRDRSLRFSSVVDLAAALHALSLDELSERSLDASVSCVPRPPRVRRWLGGLCVLTVIAGCAGVLALAVQNGRIRLPNALDLPRLPASISAWHLPFLAPAPTEPAPKAPPGPAAYPAVPAEHRSLAPAAPVTPAKPLTDVQVRASDPGVSSSDSE